MFFSVDLNIKEYLLNKFDSKVIYKSIRVLAWISCYFNIKIT